MMDDDVIRIELLQMAAKAVGNKENPMIRINDDGTIGAVEPQILELAKLWYDWVRKT
jgi:hypothetical protein